MKNRKAFVWLAVVILLALVVYFNRGRIHFDWGMFWQQLRHIAWIHIAAGIALIYSTFLLRSYRWSIFLGPTRKVSPFTILGPQFIGFTAVSLFGRLADLIRPALIAKRVQLPISTQIAVYTIERMFDLGAAAIIFSSALLFAPPGLPHREIFIHTGIVSLALTAFIAVFAVVIRAAGAAVASVIHATLRPLSPSLADSVADKVRGFREGLNAISSARDFLFTTLISLIMWVFIGLAYVQTLHAFVDTPELATISFSRTMLLMGASLGASVVQLPVIGWFTQITATAFSMHEFYGAPIEAATACGALLLVVSWLSIIPAGLIAARINHVSLKAAAAESAAAAGAVESNEQPATNN
jgi:uncharacterized membrane protein YbhN (UPF0104 family)